MTWEFQPIPSGALGGSPYTFTVDVGTFALTGQTAGLKRGLRLDAAVGASAFAGQAVGLFRAKRLDAAFGAFTLSGQIAGLTHATRIPMAFGSLALSGQAVAFRRALKLTSGHGAFGLSGQTIIITGVPPLGGGSSVTIHEVQFPPKLSLGVKGGPQRRTDIVVLGSGFEERNSRWADSKRSYNAGYAISSPDDLYTVISFFEERRGQLYGFRWKDHNDYKSCAPQQTPTNLDQEIGTGTGALSTFQLKKTYGSVYNPYTRDIKKPVAGTVLIAVNGVAKTITTHYTLDTTTGIITFTVGNTPANGHAVTAGFEFDVPVRFDTDKLELNLESHLHGSIPDIPVVELRV